MNKERILILADALENQTLAKEKKLGFNMGALLATHDALPDFSGNGCGTVGCIAGWVNALFGDMKNDGTPQARDYLDLDFEEAHGLFKPAGWSIRPEDYPIERCAAVVRRLAETGEVVW